MQVGLLIFGLIGLSCAIDVQLQMEYQNTLEYVIQIVKDNRLGQFDYEHYRKCVSLQCCVCGQTFKNQAAAAIHNNLHHASLLKYDPDISILFDQLIPPQQRYQFCSVYLHRWLGDSLGDNQMEQVCYVTSWNLYRKQVWIDVVKYIVYIILGLVSLVYYAEIIKPWK